MDCGVGGLFGLLHHAGRLHARRARRRQERPLWDVEPAAVLALGLASLTRSSRGCLGLRFLPAACGRRSRRRGQLSCCEWIRLTLPIQLLVGLLLLPGLLWSELMRPLFGELR